MPAISISIGQELLLSLGSIFLVLVLLELSLEGSQVGHVTQGSLLYLGSGGSGLGGGLAGSSLAACLASLTALLILKDAAVRQNDVLAVLVEVDNLEHQGLALLGGGTVFLGQVLGSCKALNAVGIQTDLAATLGELADGTLVHAATGEDGLVGLPGVLLELLVAEAQATVLLVDVENDNVDGSINLGELTRVLDLLGP